MSLLDNEKKYCESCRETLLSQVEVWKINLSHPSNGLSGFLNKGQTFILCKKCFFHYSTQLENSIIRGKA